MEYERAVLCIIIFLDTLYQIKKFFQNVLGYLLFIFIISKINIDIS